MKRYELFALKQLQRKEQLDLLNATQAARKRAMGTHSDKYSKEIYRHHIEVTILKRNEHR